MRSTTFKTDKRSVRTRKAIKVAFLKLLKVKSLNEITVKEISEYAKINRNSFYTHYTDFDSVYDDLCADVIEGIKGLINAYSYVQIKQDALPFFEQLTELIEENKTFSEYLLFSPVPSPITRKIKDKLCDILYDVYLRERGDSNPAIPYMVSYIVGGVFDSYYIWFKNNKTYPISKLTRNLAALVERGFVLMHDIKTESSQL